MPLKRGRGKKTMASNIAEFHGGKTYAHTKEKFGKKRADAQAVAAAYSQAGEKRSKRGKKSRFGKEI